MESRAGFGVAKTTANAGRPASAGDPDKWPNASPAASRALARAWGGPRGGGTKARCMHRAFNRFWLIPAAVDWPFPSTDELWVVFYAEFVSHLTLGVAFDL